MNYQPWIPKVFASKRWFNSTWYKIRCFACVACVYEILVFVHGQAEHDLKGDVRSVPWQKLLFVHEVIIILLPEWKTKIGSTFFDTIWKKHFRENSVGITCSSLFIRSFSHPKWVGVGGFPCCVVVLSTSTYPFFFPSLCLRLSRVAFLPSCERFMTEISMTALGICHGCWRHRHGSGTVAIPCDPNPPRHQILVTFCMSFEILRVGHRLPNRQKPVLRKHTFQFDALRCWFWRGGLLVFQGCLFKTCILICYLVLFQHMLVTPFRIVMAALRWHFLESQYSVRV